jgi:hypothetical protein
MLLAFSAIEYQMKLTRYFRSLVILLLCLSTTATALKAQQPRRLPSLREQAQVEQE